MVRRVDEVNVLTNLERGFLICIVGFPVMILCFHSITVIHQREFASDLASLEAEILALVQSFPKYLFRATSLFQSSSVFSDSNSKRCVGYTRPNNILFLFFSFGFIDPKHYDGVRKAASSDGSGSGDMLPHKPQD